MQLLSNNLTCIGKMVYLAERAPPHGMPASCRHSHLQTAPPLSGGRPGLPARKLLDSNSTGQRSPERGSIIILRWSQNRNAVPV